MAGDNVEWTSEQMIENSTSWSLAGDVALLNRLKKFSKFLLTETVSINDNVDNLLNNIESVSLKLDSTKNEFHSLRNTQFIENRVYEDDETLENETTKIEEKEPTEEEKHNAMREALLKGIAVVEKYYEKIEVTVSDSDDDDGNEKSYLLQAKDQYAHRPLPYLVGSEDWYKHWHVGLLPSESESESENEDEVYSGSDLEDDLPKVKNLGSGTSCESDLDSHSGPAANSTFNDTQDRRRQIFHSSDESVEQSSSVPVKVPISDENFAEQLAAKLGDVINKSADHLGYVNTNPIKKMQQSTKYGNLFSDEPPPLDDLDDTVLPKSAHEGLFSVGRDIFGASIEEDLFGDQTNNAGQNIKRSEEKSDIFSEPDAKPKLKVAKGLFDASDDSEEDDMFAVVEKRKAKVAQPFLQPFKPTIPFVDDRPPEISPKSDNIPSRKKPVGGVSIFGENADIFSENSGKPGFEPTKAVATHDIKPRSTGAIKKIYKKASLFDESSDEDSIAPKDNNSPVSKKPANQQGIKKVGLFDDADDILNPKIQETLKKSEEKKKLGLFDDDTFLTSKKEDVEHKKELGLFDENPYKNIDIFRPTSKEIAHKTENLDKTATESNKPIKKISLFDDDDDFLKEEEDIFATVPKKISLLEDLTAAGLFEDTKGKTSSKFFADEASTSEKQPKGDLDEEYPSENVTGGQEIGSNLEKKSQILREETLGKKSTETLFDDLETSGSPDDLFGGFKTQETSQKKVYNQRKVPDVLFKDMETSTITIPFEDSTDINVKDGNKTVGRDEGEEKAAKNIKDLENLKEEGSLFIADEIEKTNPVSLETIVVKQKEASLFDDDHHDDLFGGSKNTLETIYQKDHVEEPKQDVLKHENEASVERSLENAKEGKAIDEVNNPEQDDHGSSNKDPTDRSEGGLKPIRHDRKIRKSVGFYDSASESSDDDFGFRKNTKDKENNSGEQATKGYGENDWLNVEEPKPFGLPERNDDENAGGSSNISRDKSEGTTNETEAALNHDQISTTNASKNYITPPPIDLFDPTPPPLDWDAGSDNSGESDTFSLTDGMLNRTTFNQSQARSSLFDEAPPSLDANDSSGIVRDLNVTRVETDDSSFYPYASSSRRLSSDIFGEQESQDSFFVTKNRSESSARSGGILDKIPENVEKTWSKIENLTPSGNLEDFEDSSVFESGNKSKDINSEGMDTSTSVSELKKPPTSPPIKNKPKESQGEDIIAAKRLDNAKQRVSLFEAKYDIEKEDKSQEQDDTKEKLITSPVKTSPGKLQHNLKINVSALLPGAARPKIPPTVAKSSSLDETDKSAPSSPPVVSRVATSKNDSIGDLNVDDNRKFENLSKTEVLQSATKDRAKIPVKRRPSTRRARQEAVRKSMTDFSLYQNEEVYSVDDEQSSQSDKVVRRSSGRDKKDILKDLENRLKIPAFVPKKENSKIEDIVEKTDEPTEAKGISLVFGERSEKQAEKREEPLENPVSSSSQKELSSKALKPIEIFNSESDPSNSHRSEKDDSKPGLKATFEDLFKDSAQRKGKRDKGLFGGGGGSDSSEEDLFSSTRSVKKDVSSIDKPLQPEEGTGQEELKPSIFSDRSDSEGDGDLFSGNPQRPTSKSVKKASKKSSIFDDSDDNSEEDLFSSKSSKTRSRSGDISGKTGSVLSTRMESKNVKIAGVKKLENKVTDFDPLSAFK